MDIRCSHCGIPAEPAGHMDARAFYQCQKCKRVWMVHLASVAVGMIGRAQGPPIRVLVVDDSDQLVSLIECWLEDEGYQVSTATSGRQALEAAAAHRPDIVLLDLIIPPPDGFAVCDALRRHERPPEIIMMTGASDPLRLQRAGDLGSVTLLRKPLTQEGVLAAVAAARRRRWSEDIRADVRR